MRAASSAIRIDTSAIRRLVLTVSRSPFPHDISLYTVARSCNERQPANRFIASSASQADAARDRTIRATGFERLSSEQYRLVKRPGSSGKPCEPTPPPGGPPRRTLGELVRHSLEGVHGAIQAGLRPANGPNQSLGKLFCHGDHAQSRAGLC